ncbi:MAG: putative baseplate assembly protein, partial [Verrucomicrobia bacterium]|nr:putative baseplate assembly protein [Verrucomicrobiota bacterium]
FTLKETPGQPPDPAAPAMTIPEGSQVQSVPTQGQKPQTFETASDVLAKPDWNALAVQSTRPWLPKAGDTGSWLTGVATQLQPGDLILIVGDERMQQATSPNWDLRAVGSVTVDARNHRTFVTWTEPLGWGSVPPTSQNPKFYAFRQRAALFGYNALDPKLLDPNTTLANLKTLNLVNGNDWVFTDNGSAAAGIIDLDAAYPKVTPDGWIALLKPDQQTSRSPAGFISLYRVLSVTTVSHSQFGLSSKISRVAADTTLNLAGYYSDRRRASALAQSELLEVPEQPLPYPLYGGVVDLEELRPDLAGVTVIALSGKRQKIAVKSGVTSLAFVPDDETTAAPLNPGDILTISSPIPLPVNPDGSPGDWSISSTAVTFDVEDAAGRPGSVEAAPNQFTLVASDPHDPAIAECALVDSVASVDSPHPHTQLTLKFNLANCYERATTVINANVVLATHGQSVSEILGSGNAATPNQDFALKQSPLTYVQAPTPTGRLSTLDMQVAGVAWSEVPSLYAKKPNAQLFASRNNADGTTDVLFGDGAEGALLPTGQNNLHANYRIGSGAAGNVPAGTLTTLLDRPLGVSQVTNPQAATGGQDAQPLDGIRSNAPQTVLTLGRAVSVTDYQDFAGTFAGVAKAYARWIPCGPGRGVFLTVAGVGGGALPPGNPTLAKLDTALRNLGNPLIPITIVSFLETTFGFSADLQYDPAYDLPTVQGQVRDALAAAFSFATRAFGQGVSADEVAAFIQAVPGVVAVNVTGLHPLATSAAGDLGSQAGGFTLRKYNQWLAQQVTLPRPVSDTPTRICAALPVASLKALPMPAEILVLDPNPDSIRLGAMS